MTILGLHHITLVCANAQRTVDFYTRGLGLRLVKQTVNFDDPGSYHLYFGDKIGRPGTAVTFFEWAGAKRGHIVELATLGPGFLTDETPDELGRGWVLPAAGPRERLAAP